MKPVSIRIHDSNTPYFYYEGMPIYVPFDQFELLAIHYVRYHLKDDEKPWIEATVVFDNDDGMYCNLILNKEKCLCFTDMVGNMLYSFEHDKHKADTIKHVKPLFDQIQFSKH